MRLECFFITLHDIDRRPKVHRVLFVQVCFLEFGSKSARWQVTVTRCSFVFHHVFFPFRYVSSRKLSVGKKLVIEKKCRLSRFTTPSPTLPRPLAQWKKRLITSYWQTGSLSLIRPYLDAYGKIEVNFKKVQKFLFEKRFASVLLGSQVNGGIGREDSRGEYPLRRAHKMVLHLPLTPPIESPKSSYPL